VDIEEFAPHMRPAARLDDPTAANNSLKPA
jgi:hypothetical protein